MERFGSDAASPKWLKVRTRIGAGAAGCEASERRAIASAGRDRSNCRRLISGMCGPPPTEHSYPGTTTLNAKLAKHEKDSGDSSLRPLRLCVPTRLFTTSLAGRSPIDAY